MYRIVRQISVLLLFSLLVQSCSTTLRNTWRDFNGYFNTYYNAKTSFERGLETQQQQTVEINPERPIRIHPTPQSAGQNDFEHAVQKSADVIRFHPQSRWVDNAIELIGMSYFYLGQFFSADQKFVELLNATSDPEMRQRAILWRGRAALELENYVEGVNYIQSRLFSSEFDWDPEIEAEIKLIIAQLYVAREEYEDAEVYLTEALPDVSNRKLEMRSHFLHGQLLEILENYDEAFEAYNRATHQSNPSYDLIYHAERKLGVVARKQGELDWAYDHFVAMSRDDRHFEYITAIEYEIARTLQEQGRFTEAREMYEQTLRRRNQNSSSEVQAKVYYGMGEIYRDHFLDYTLTAAYFDSSASQATDPERLPENFDADALADSYGDYSRLKNEINRLDSLLWLGSLSQAELDSVVAEVRERRIAEMEEEASQQQRQQMVSVDDIDEAGAPAEENTDDGFLNYQNPRIMQQMSQAFQAVWGQRPLVDDWRRMEEVRVNIVRQYEEEGEEVDDMDEVIEDEMAPQQNIVEVDLSEVPFTEEEKQETREKIASHEYEVGNVFFTSLAEPDSAARYYRNVMSRFPDSELAPQAIYSLSELYQSTGDSVNALQYAMQLVDFYPNTVYAERMADRFNLERDLSDLGMSREDSLSMIYDELTSMERSVERAGKLRDFVGNYPDAENAPDALYRAVLDYVETARQDDQYAYILNELSLARIIWEQEKDTRETFRDSVEAILADSSFMAAVLEYEVAPVERASPDNRTVASPDTVETEVDTTQVELDTTAAAAAEPETDSGAGSVETEVDTTQAELDTTAAAAAEPETDSGAGSVESPESAKSAEELFQEIVNKPIEEPDFDDIFPYEGALWDSARVVLLTLRDEYPDFSRSTVVNALAEEIEVDRIHSALVDTTKVYSCSELDEHPELAGGVEQFLDVSGLQELVDSLMINRNVVIEVVIDKEGAPIEVYSDDSVQRGTADAGNSGNGGSEGNPGDSENAGTSENGGSEGNPGDSENAGTSENGGSDVSSGESENDGNQGDTEEEGEDTGDGEPDIVERLIRAVEEHMRFEPPTLHDVGVQARCEYTIELSP